MSQNLKLGFRATWQTQNGQISGIVENVIGDEVRVRLDNGETEWIPKVFIWNEDEPTYNSSLFTGRERIPPNSRFITRQRREWKPKEEVENLLNKTTSSEKDQEQTMYNRGTILDFGSSAKMGKYDHLDLEKNLPVHSNSNSKNKNLNDSTVSSNKRKFDDKNIVPPAVGITFALPPPVPPPRNPNLYHYEIQHGVILPTVRKGHTHHLDENEDYYDNTNQDVNNIDTDKPFRLMPLTPEPPPPVPTPTRVETIQPLPSPRRVNPFPPAIPPPRSDFQFQQNNSNYYDNMQPQSRTLYQNQPRGFFYHGVWYPYSDPMTTDENINDSNYYYNIGYKYNNYTDNRIKSSEYKTETDNLSDTSSGKGKYRFHPELDAWLNIGNNNKFELTSGFSIQELGSIQKQLEYYFSDDNLLKDTYIYDVMDKKGYIFASEFAKWSRMKKLGANESIIIEAAIHSPFIKVSGNKLRKRRNWEKFLPNSPNRPPKLATQNHPSPHIDEDTKKDSNKKNENGKEVSRDIISKIIQDLEKKHEGKKKKLNDNKNASSTKSTTTVAATTAVTTSSTNTNENQTSQNVSEPKNENAHDGAEEVVDID